ncbi:bacillithiol system redox-active protein YtxJ [Psychrobacillus psychrotolerans]|uniref:bacillithiol system redox-active protein YtxJ n=1 Tax=Psychrobacillus psychrotolerans TaxID=126156 RepID=UPI003C7692F8
MGNYKEITTVNQWQNIFDESKDKAILVFKHSTTCPVSAHAYGEFTAFSNSIESYLVKVIENRAVSNEISKDLGIQHESPQAFVIANSDVVWNASHWKITKKELDKVTASL